MVNMLFALEGSRYVDDGEALSQVSSRSTEGAGQDWGHVVCDLGVRWPHLGRLVLRQLMQVLVPVIALWVRSPGEIWYFAGKQCVRHWIGLLQIGLDPWKQSEVMGGLAICCLKSAFNAG